MRVLHVTNYLPYFHRVWGGAEMACSNVIGLLAEGGGGVTQAVAATVPQEEVKGPFAFFPVETIQERHPAHYFFFMRHYWLQKDHIVAGQIGAALDTFKPDVVHFHNFNILTFSALEAVKARGLPALLSIYDYWMFCPTNMLIDLNNRPCADGHGLHCIWRCLHKQFYKKSHYLLNMPIITRKGYFLRALRMFDAVITLSENSRQIVERRGGPQVDARVVRMVVDGAVKREDAQVNKAATTPRVALYAGWVQARKGPDALVKAMAEVVKQMPDARLFIIGELSESAFEAYIRGLVRRLGLENNIVITGKLEKEEFRKHFDMASAVLIAEQWENMSPVFMLESMSAGKALVCGRIGGIPEFIRDGVDGLLARSDDPSDFAQKILAVFGDEALAQRLGASAKERVASLCGREQVRESLLDVYKSVVAAPRHEADGNG